MNMSASRRVGAALQHISAGYVDERLRTVRSMAREGATGAEIAAAIGMSAGGVGLYIRRNGIVWNHKTAERHILLSASAIGVHQQHGRGAEWHEEAVRLRLSGTPIAEIAQAVGKTYSAVSVFLSKRGVRSPKAKRLTPQPLSTKKMLSLIIRLHAEGVLSEGQVSDATGLDREEIRRLRDQKASAA